MSYYDGQDITKCDKTAGNTLSDQMGVPVTVQLDSAIRAGADNLAKKTSRSGTNKRQRTEQVKLSLLPTERQALERAAARSGFAGTLQQFILHKLDLDLAAV